MVICIWENKIKTTKIIKNSPKIQQRKIADLENKPSNISLMYSGTILSGKNGNIQLKSIGIVWLGVKL